MGLSQFIFSKLFLRHLGMAVAAGVVFLVMVHFMMGFATEHGTVVEVPSYLGVPMTDLDEFSDTIPLEYVIIDSIYSDAFPKGTVADQDPAAGTGAKRGRKVYLTVNAMMPQQIKMPDLRNLSFRQAKAILETLGLRLGGTSFRPDIAKNAVLDQFAKGRSIKPGQLLFKGSKVDLVLGDGLSGAELTMPYLIYHRLDSAVLLLRSLSLNVGAIVVDGAVTDSTRLRVFRQIPAYSRDMTIQGGNNVDLFLTEDTASISFDQFLYQSMWNKDTVSASMEPIEDYEEFEAEDEIN
jgi:beta-lactam-binding protein with PASTA domain